LLVLLNACNVGTAVPQLSSAQWTAIVQTQEAMRLAPEQTIKNLINATPASLDDFEVLENALVGTYLVKDVTLPSPEYLQVEVLCQCASNSPCCNPDHIFVVILQKISESRDLVVPNVRSTVQWLVLVCYDGQMNRVGLRYVRWDRIKAFLFDQITGADLLSDIIR
jgi:hypothetical protein